MIASEIALQRLYHQGLSLPMFENPAEAVKWLGAVQSQDYAGAKWAVGQRTTGTTDAIVEQAFTDGTILRTHVMRPTWHFVAPGDIRWLLALTAPRVHAISAYMYRQLELDEAIFARSKDVLIKTLQGGKQLTRSELGGALMEVGILAEGLRLAYIVGCAELDGLICSGARRGKQFTYALLEERAPNARVLARDEALAELVTRYFVGHGPATLQDFVWWPGLMMADAKAGVEMVKSRLNHEVIDGQTYWFSEFIPLAKGGTPAAYLLPNYDESLASYKNRSASLDPKYAHRWDRGNAIFSHHIVIDGQIVGSWKQTFSKGVVKIGIAPFERLTDAENQAVAEAAARYGEFLGLPVLFS